MVCLVKVGSRKRKQEMQNISNHMVRPGAVPPDLLETMRKFRQHSLSLFLHLALSTLPPACDRAGMRRNMEEWCNFESVKTDHLSLLKSDDVWIFKNTWLSSGSHHWVARLVCIASSSHWWTKTCSNSWVYQPCGLASVPMLALNRLVFQHALLETWRTPSAAWWRVLLVDLRWLKMVETMTCLFIVAFYAWELVGVKLVKDSWLNAA